MHTFHSFVDFKIKPDGSPINLLTFSVMHNQMNDLSWF